MLSLVVTVLAVVLQRPEWEAGAPSGTGLEWMTIMAVVLPLLVLIVLGYQGSKHAV